MRKYNFTRPLLIIAVAFLVNSLTSFICISFGASPETASNIAFGAMMVAVVLTFIRLNKSRNKR